MMSPYRDATAALETKLRVLVEARGELDAPIAETLRELEPHRQARRRERGRALLALAVPSAGELALLLAIVALSVPWASGGSPIRDTRIGASVIRSASNMYLADQPDNTCPDVDVLVKQGFLNPSTPTTDGWDRPFVIECDGVEVTVLSAGPDGEHGTPDDIVD